MNKGIRIAIVAGEASGDLLGAALVSALHEHLPDAQFEGLAGPRMQAHGVKSLYAMERLSVMGLVAILKRLPELLRMRKQLIRYWLEKKPDVMIGIDAPEFNLGLEECLRRGGVLTVHFVSPSVWAWREKRIFKIQRAVDLMLALFPFELPIYQRYGIPVVHTGHPLADTIPLHTNQGEARRRLGLSETHTLLAVLPGSRGSELNFLSEPFIAAMQILSQRNPTLQFAVPLVNEKRESQFSRALQKMGTVPNLHLFRGQSHEILQACDAVMMASGTATLEAMLYKRPMVVAYKVGAFSHWLFRRLLKVNRFALPNLLSGKDLVPELMQDEVNALNLADCVSQQLQMNAAQSTILLQTYHELHQQLRCNAAERAALAILQLLRDKKLLA